MSKQHSHSQPGQSRTILYLICLLLTFQLTPWNLLSAATPAPDNPQVVSEHTDSQHPSMAQAPPVYAPTTASAQTMAEPAQDQAVMDTAGTESAQQDPLVLYRCPMHPEEVSDKPGRCRICGMFLQSKNDSSAQTAGMDMPPMKDLNALEQPAQHDHDHEPTGLVFSCPMHPEEVSDMPGRCRICGMYLQPIPDSSAPTAAMDMPPIKQTPPEQSQPHAHQHASTGHLYSCPMHPEEVSDRPGRCRICGMDLVQTNAAESDTKTSQQTRPVEQTKTADNLHTTEAMVTRTHDHQDSTYVCPMHPQIVSEHPGSCPICGMDLVLKKVEFQDSALPVVKLSMAVVQNMGVRIARVERGTLGKTIRTQGRVTYDEDRIIRVHPRTAGWIENLYIRTDGVRVERKDNLADYFSPDILMAQQDYLSALQDSALDSFGSPNTADTLRAFRERTSVDMLRYLKVPSMDIIGLQRSMEPKSIIPIMAPQSGVVIEHNVREGTFVTPATNLFTIADLSSVWIMVDIFEHQLAWVRSGLMAKVTTPAYPGRSWQSKLDFVYPEVDPKARTMRARLEVKNPGELLLPNMFVQIDLATTADQQDVLTVPRDAVILTGEREVVIKDLGEGRFQPVEVKTGLWNDTHAEILSGLDAGDKVVVSGQFLIDSESSLQASFRRFEE